MTKKNSYKPAANKDWRKKIKINYSRKEFIKKYKNSSISRYMFKTILPKFLNYFEIEKKDLKRENIEEAEYEIQYDIADLLCLMLKNYNQNPLYRINAKTSAIASSTISKYNNVIIDDIEKLPDYLKYFIKKNENFKFNYTLAKYMPILLDRLSLLFTTMSLYSNSNSGNILTDLIVTIDNLTDKYYTHASELEYNRKNTNINILNVGTLNSFNAQNDLGYSIDNILRETFKIYHRENNSKFYAAMPKDLNDEILNSSENNLTEPELDTLRDKYTNFLNSVYTTPQKLEEQRIEYEKINAQIYQIKNLINPHIFMENKEIYINDFKTNLYIALDKYKNKGGSINNYFEGINLALFIIKLDKIFDTEEDLDNAIDSLAEEFYSHQLKYVKLKYQLYRELKEDESNSNLIRKHLDLALGQTLLLILDKEYSAANSTTQKS